MGNVNSYKDLEVWKKAMDLVVEIYNLTEFNRTIPASRKIWTS